MDLSMFLRCTALGLVCRGRQWVSAPITLSPCPDALVLAGGRKRGQVLLEKGPGWARQPPPHPTAPPPPPLRATVTGKKKREVVAKEAEAGRQAGGGRVEEAAGVRTGLGRQRPWSCGASAPTGLIQCRVLPATV